MSKQIEEAHMAYMAEARKIHGDGCHSQRLQNEKDTRSIKRL